MTAGGTWDGHRAGSTEYRRIVIALTAAAVVAFAQLYAPQGILPLIGRGLSVSVATSALTVSAGTIGLALSVLGWSWVADRIGRAPAMKIAVTVSIVLGLVVAAAPTFEVLLALRVLQGVSLAAVPALAVAYLTEEVHRNQLPAAAGAFVSGNSIGGLSGRLLATQAGDVGGWRWGFESVGILSVLAGIVFLVLLPPARGFVRPSGRPTSVRYGVWVNLRDPRTLVLFGQAFLLMGGFVAIYNYLSYRLEAAPFHLSVSVVGWLFLAYLAGTISSRVAGSLAASVGRRRVMLGSTLVMIGGVALTLPAWLPSIVVGLLILTAGFFAAHSIAFGWVGERATTGKAQATALYNLGYYGGSSLFGWLGGFAFLLGWWGTAVMVMLLAAIAFVWAYVVARD